MRITRLTAEKVHGYLPLDVQFFDDLTFLTGLNGSGKTSALRLLMALLTPNIDELGSITFSSAAVTVDHEGQEILVRADKNVERVMLTTSFMPHSALYISSSDLELYMDVRRREEARSPLLEKYQQNPVYDFIRKYQPQCFWG